MAKPSTDREADFTTLRVTKRDKELLQKLSLHHEYLWETFRRITEAAAISGIKKAKKRGVRDED